MDYIINSNGTVFSKKSNKLLKPQKKGVVILVCSYE